MTHFYALFLAVCVTLLPITNPLGIAAIFLSMTEGNTLAERRSQALRGSIYMFILLCVFFLSGALIMKFFGLTLPGIRIAGGLVVAKIGFDLLTSNEDSANTKEEHAEGRKKADISFSPLAMPLLAGPGAIAAIMGLAGNLETHDVAHYSVVIAGILTVSAICWIVLRSSDQLLKFLGVNGAHALTKIMGFLLLCMGVQLMINGITALNLG